MRFASLSDLQLFYLGEVLAILQVILLLKEISGALITSEECIPENTHWILFHFYCYIFIIADQEVCIEYKMP